MSNCPNHPKWPVYPGSDVCAQCAIVSGVHELPEQMLARVKPVRKLAVPKAKVRRKAKATPGKPIPKRLRPSKFGAASTLAEVAAMIQRIGEKIADDLAEHGCTDDETLHALWLGELQYVLRTGAVAVARDRRRAEARAAERRAQGRTLGRLVSIDGETKIILDWAREAGVSESTIRMRLKRGIKGARLIAPAWEA
jgi:hypothetical protein